MRVYALYRHCTREVERLIHPSSVAGAGRMGRFLRRKGAQLAWVFVMLFLLSIAVLMAGLTLAGLEFEPAMVLGRVELFALITLLAPDGWRN